MRDERAGSSNLKSKRSISRHRKRSGGIGGAWVLVRRRGKLLYGRLLLVISFFLPSLRSISLRFGLEM